MSEKITRVKFMATGPNGTIHSHQTYEGEMHFAEVENILRTQYLDNGHYTRLAIESCAIYGIITKN